MYLVRQLGALRRDTRGVSAIEFAFIAPVLMLLLFGILEFGMIMTVQSVMEGATANSSRLGKTGYVAASKTREETIRDAISDRVSALINPDQLTITSKFYSQFDEINDPEPYTDANGNGHYDVSETYSDINGNAQWDADMGAAGYGAAGDIVVYTISYPWQVMTPIMSDIIGQTVTLTTHAVVKNEPY